jgi:hypothetical protein
MNIPKKIKRAESVLLVLLSVLFITVPVNAQTLPSSGLSAGFIIGDPLGITMKYQFVRANALDVGFGPDYFGSPRLQIDYVWEFNLFHSTVTNEYVGPGLAVALGKGTKMFFSREPHLESFANQEDNGFGFGGRAIFGLNINPQSSRIQYFVEAGPLIAFKRIFDLDLDGAVGVQYRL